MSYTTKEVTEKLNISKHTLRYYEKEGLIPIKFSNIAERVTKLLGKKDNTQDL